MANARLQKAPRLRLIDCTTLAKPVNQQTVSVLRLLLAKAQAGEVTDIACVYGGNRETDTVLTGAFEDDPQRATAEMLRASALRLLAEDA
jgi:hypothetical protein